MEVLKVLAMVSRDVLQIKRESPARIRYKELTVIAANSYKISLSYQVHCMAIAGPRTNTLNNNPIISNETKRISKSLNQFSINWIDANQYIKFCWTILYMVLIWHTSLTDKSHKTNN
jgi:hypothetical protein